MENSANNRLWYDFLEKSALQFQRGQVFGSHVVDFYSPKARLAVEVLRPGREDRARTAYLSSLGVEELCCAESSVNDLFDGVCDIIRTAASKRCPQ